MRVLSLKTSKSKVYFVCLAAFLSVGIDEPSTAAEKIVTLTADVWCPYNCDQSSRDQGFMVEAAREILKTQGYTLTYGNQTWSRALADVRAGQRDAIIGASQAEAEGLALVEEPLGENKNCFYTRIDDPYIYRPDSSMANRRIGVAAGYLYGEPIDQYVKKNRVNYNLVQIGTGDQPLLQNLRKLKARRVDTVIENMLVMDFSLRKYLFDGVRLAGCDEPKPLYMAFSPKRADAGRLKDIMSRGIRELKKTGRMREILARYGLTDWK